MSARPLVALTRSRPCRLSVAFDSAERAGNLHIVRAGERGAGVDRRRRRRRNSREPLRQRGLPGQQVDLESGRAIRGGPPKGHPARSQASRRNLSGKRDRRGEAERIRLAPFLSCREKWVLKETPLNAVHRAAGARMVDFGGWDMPVNYGSQIDEHHAVRSDAGMFDVSHMRVVDLEGAGARDFLRHALANNVDKLKDAGKALYSCLLHDAGQRHRRPDRLFPARGLLPPGRQRGHGGQGHRLVPQAHRGARAGPGAHAARRPRDDRGAGPERAREGLAGASRQRGGERVAEAVHGRVDAHRVGRAVHRAHRLHRRGRFRNRAAGDARAASCGARSSPPA